MGHNTNQVEFQDDVTFDEGNGETVQSNNKNDWPDSGIWDFKEHTSMVKEKVDLAMDLLLLGWYIVQVHFGFVFISLGKKFKKERVKRI